MPIKNLIMDVDGVLNTGHFFYSAEGKMFKAFGAHDKDGIKMAQKYGLTIDFITADKTGWDITCARLIKDWGMSPDSVHLVTEEDRLTWIQNRYNTDEVAYMADGYHDAHALRNVALGIAPNNARKEAKFAASYITESDAGSGAVLDAVIYITKVHQ